MPSPWNRALAWVRSDPWATPHDTQPATTPRHRTYTVHAETRTLEIR